MQIVRYDQASEQREITGDWQGWLYAHGFLRIRLVPVLGPWHRLMLEVWKGAAGREFMVYQPPVEDGAVPEMLYTALPDSDTLEAFLRATRGSLKEALFQLPTHAAMYAHH
ncbi:MAG: hypothetical protein H0X37_12570 [Herpetosiphonaceae bacterium]|nr:hypothetical protein [Herpetosiphonaceae bacterium]